MRRYIVAVLIAGALLAWWLARRGDDAPRVADGQESTERRTGLRTERAGVEVIELTGRVTRSNDGVGLAGATVAIAARIETAIVPPTIVVTSDRDGEWRAPVQRGSYVVSAMILGYVPAHAEREAPGRIELGLAAGGATLSGTIADSTGGPILGARVTTTRDHAEFVAITDAKGQYQLTLPDGGFWVGATHQDYVSANSFVMLAGSPATLNFTLDPGSAIDGQVIARETGQPVPDAIVELVDSLGQTESRSDSQISDRDGHFVIHHVPAGRHGLVARARGYTTATPQPLAVGVGEPLDGVRVLVDRGYTISGRVKDGGNNVAGVRVRASTRSPIPSASSRAPSADDGVFELVGLPHGRYTLEATGDVVARATPIDIEVVDHDIANITVDIARGVTVRGRIDPVVTGITYIYRTDPGSSWWSRDGMIGPNGELVFPHIPRGRYSLVADAPDGREGSTSVRVTDGDVEGVVVKLEQRAALSGRVVDERGMAVAGCFVAANFAMTTTRADGTYRFVNLQPGRIEVTAGYDDTIAAYGNGDPAHPPTVVEVAIGAEKTGVAIVIESRDRQITGRVVDADRKPVPDAIITARRRLPTDHDNSDLSVRATTQTLARPDGSFTLARLAAGIYQLEATDARGTARAVVRSIQAGQDVAITLGLLGKLRGQVTIGTRPVTSYDLACYGPTTAKRRIEAADGSYQLDGLAPGAYTCGVTSGEGTAGGRVEVKADGTRLDLALVGRATLTGTVVDIWTGKPVPGLAVASYASAIGSSVENSTTDAIGRFVVDHAISGSGFVSIDLSPRRNVALGRAKYVAAEGEHVDLGVIRVLPVPGDEPGTFGMGWSRSFVITDILPTGPAARAGLREGDQISAINGVPVSSLTPFVPYAFVADEMVTAGQTYRLDLERGEKVSVTAVPL